MTVLAEVVDESIKNMESGLVSRAEQEKVSLSVYVHAMLRADQCRAMEWQKYLGTKFS